MEKKKSFNESYSCNTVNLTQLNLPIRKFYQVSPTHVKRGNLSRYYILCQKRREVSAILNNLMDSGY